MKTKEKFINIMFFLSCISFLNINAYIETDKIDFKGSPKVKIAPN